MIEATEMIKRVGKKKFVEIASQARPGGEAYGDIERRRERGRTTYRWCAHSVLVFANGEKYGKAQTCEKCEKERHQTFTVGREFVPHFNSALGGWVESRQDMMRTAKAKGLIHIGTDKLR